MNPAVNDSLAARLREIVAELLDVLPSAITDDTVLGGSDPADSPLLDSLDLLKFGLMLTEEFGVGLPASVPATLTIADVVKHVKTAGSR